MSATVKAVEGELSRSQIDLLKRTICIGATDDELQLFLHACKRTKLDPFMRQIHAVKRWSDGKERMTIQTGIDGYRLIADRTGRYMPSKSPRFESDDKGRLVSCTCFCKKADAAGEWHEIEHTVFWNEYVAKTKDGRATKMWDEKPKIMLAKCCEASLLRKAFPADLSGVYTTDEMLQADNYELRLEHGIDPNALLEAPPAPEREAISPEVACELEEAMSELGDDGFKEKAMNHLSQKEGVPVKTAYDLTAEQAGLLSVWIEKKKKKR